MHEVFIVSGRAALSSLTNKATALAIKEHRVESDRDDCDGEYK